MFYSRVTWRDMNQHIGVGQLISIELFLNNLMFHIKGRVPPKCKLGTHSCGFYTLIKILGNPNVKVLLNRTSQDQVTCHIRKV